jgi:hypothetical protein
MPPPDDSLELHGSYDEEYWAAQRAADEAYLRGEETEAGAAGDDNDNSNGHDKRNDGDDDEDDELVVVGRAVERPLNERYLNGNDYNDGGDEDSKGGQRKDDEDLVRWRADSCRCR